MRRGSKDKASPGRSSESQSSPTPEIVYHRFIRTSGTGLVNTLVALWSRVSGLRLPFRLDADEDMAKFTFNNLRSFHLCTNTRRFHRPGKTGKTRSVTIIMGGKKESYDDPEHQLIPCDAARTIDCCYFGMGEDEVDLAMFFIEQMVTLSPVKKPGFQSPSSKRRRRRSDGA